MKDASWSRTFVDLEIADLRIERTYDSRSRHLGLFGFGWCSPFEVRVTVTANDLRVNECGQIRSYKRSTDVSGKNKFSFYSVSAGRHAKARFEAGQNGTFKEVKPNGEERHFDQQGRLTGILGATRRPIRLSYGPTGLLREAATGEGVKVRFEIDPITKQVVSISSLAPFPYPLLRVDYLYDGPDLREIRNAWKNKYRFSYDSLHNLVRIDYPDGSSEKLTYNQDLDQITSYSGRDGCTEIYKFEEPTPLATLNRIKPTQIFKSRARKSCKGQRVAEAQFEFWHRLDPIGREILALSRITRNGETLEIEHDPQNGAPLRRTIQHQNPKRRPAHFDSKPR